MRDGSGRRQEEFELEDECDDREASCLVMDLRGSCDDFRSVSRNLKRACVSGSAARCANDNVLALVLCVVVLIAASFRVPRFEIFG